MGQIILQWALEIRSCAKRPDVLVTLSEQSRLIGGGVDRDIQEGLVTVVVL